MWSIYYEIQTLCKLFNMNEKEVRQTDDAYCHEHLIANKKYINCETRLFDLKNPRK